MARKFLFLLFGFLIVGMAGLLIWEQQDLSASNPVVINGTSVAPLPALDTMQISQGEALYPPATEHSQGRAAAYRGRA